MASTVWRGQLTFGLVSFPVRLLIAARKKRVALHYLRQPVVPVSADEPDDEPVEVADETRVEQSSRVMPEAPVARVRQEWMSASEGEAVAPQELVKGYEVSPDRYVTFNREELRAMRPANSPDMQILRSVRLADIDPVYFETSYYVIPDRSADRPYSLLFAALQRSGYVAIAKVTMHGREHVVVVRPGEKSLLAHTIYYNDEIRADNEFKGVVGDVAPKELKLAESFVEAIAGEFAPEEFKDTHRELLEQMIASKLERDAVSESAPVVAGKPPSPVVNILEALQRSLDLARKPAKAEAPKKKAQRRRA